MYGKTQIKKWFKEYMNPIVKPYGFKIGTFNKGGFFIYREDEKGHDSFLIGVESSDKLYVSGDLKRINLIHEILYEITGYYMFGNYTDRTMIGATDCFKKPIRIVSKNHLFEYLYEFNEQFPLYVQQLDHYNDPINILKLWETLDTFDKQNIHFQNGSYKFHLILFLEKIMQHETKRNWRKTVDVFIEEQIVKGNNKYIQIKEDLLKVERYFEITSPEKLEDIRKELINLSDNRGFKIKPQSKI